MCLKVISGEPCAPHVLCWQVPLRCSLQFSQTLPTAGTANGGAKHALLALLREGALREAASVIVYCTFQSQADEVARFLYTSGVSAVSYHARKHMKVTAQGVTAAQVPQPSSLVWKV